MLPYLPREKQVKSMTRLLHVAAKANKYVPQLRHEVGMGPRVDRILVIQAANGAQYDGSPVPEIPDHERPAHPSPGSRLVLNFRIL